MGTWPVLVGVLLLSACTAEREGAGSDTYATGDHFRELEPYGIVYPIRPGKTVADGNVVLWLEADKPVTLLGIESVGGDPSLTYVGAKVIGPERRPMRQPSINTYPPPAHRFGAPLRPVMGAVVKPVKHTRLGLGYQVITGYRFTGLERTFRQGVMVKYVYEGARYQQFIPAGIVACPPDASEMKCLDWGATQEEN